MENFSYDFKNARVLKPGEKIPEGAVRMHLYPVVRALAPRGSLKKESLSEYILEKLNDYYESWTDEKYGDNPPKDELMEILHTNLEQEMRIAWREFMLQNRFSK